MEIAGLNGKLDLSSLDLKTLETNLATAINSLKLVFTPENRASIIQRAKEHLKVLDERGESKLVDKYAQLLNKYTGGKLAYDIGR